MSHLISKRASSRKISHFANDTLQEAPKGFEPHPSLLHLDYGTPNDGFFPVKSIGISVKNTAFEVVDAIFDGSKSVGDVTSLQESKVLVSNRASDPRIIDIATGLQYSEIKGIPQLQKFTREVVVKAHPPIYSEWKTIISGGAGEGLNKAIDVFLDEGEVVLLEEFTFTPILQNIQNAGAIPIPIKLDLNTSSDQANGIDLEYLTNLLENWDDAKPELKGIKPNALYTISSGQNPTGLHSKLGKHDFAIIEDDPYGYLTLPPYEESNVAKRPICLEVEDYFQNHLIPSYLTIDTSGRVLRIETFSKLFAPGLRLGYMVGHEKVIDAIARYSAVVTRSSSGVSQLLVNNVIEQNFGGVDGWFKWILKLRGAYAKRRNVLLYNLFELKAYKKGYLDLIDPRAGMFVCVVINFPVNTDIKKKLALLQWKFRIKMAVDPEFSLERGNFFRLTFAPVETETEIAEGACRFSAAVYDFFEKGLEF
ncbi:PLP-dependent transferase [Metschnikowia bicuspidata var. bicuspidata NRRL YB-4993]|uniref:PLP-dependent transferase n=1 Tax=Metschnikowia bicuspidata var. bicuspidata NRRL YB-4993 TaxID=869754 RepID=A0A1A0HHT7_9ASCO|nr:PLP-dependent transferase [Metschnikowia bicuspidata var. bicuspidata NRRL YB-4993]OBA23408.1 PLP-dependent transferase [Metschnikowia bicuspidata var. bicuspidata NRRL YB-4993]